METTTSTSTWKPQLQLQHGKSYAQKIDEFQTPYPDSHTDIRI
jgi:hypothetical protein